MLPDFHLGLTIIQIISPQYIDYFFYTIDVIKGTATMNLAIFDLDNTLINGDSDHAWGEFLVENSIVDRKEYALNNDQFYRDYKLGALDINAYLHFCLKVLAEHPLEQLLTWRKQFIEEKIRPILLPKAQALVK